jgi:WD40 repeat protein
MTRHVWHLGLGLIIAVSRPCGGQDSTPSRAILYVNGRGNHAVRPDGHAITLPGWDRSVNLPVWSPSGASWAYARGEMRSRTVSLQVRGWKGSPRILFTNADEMFMPTVIAWAPDGVRLATIIFRQVPPYEAVAVFDAAQGELIARYSLPTDLIDPEEASARLSWSPDGTKILIVSGLALVIDVARGTVDTLGHDVLMAQWTPGSDGLYLMLTDSTDSTRASPLPRKFWELYERRLNAPVAVKLFGRDSLTAFGLEPMDPSGLWTASPSGSRLVVWTPPPGDESSDSSGSTIYLYDLSKDTPLALGSPARRVRVPNWWIVRPVEWSPDERSVAMFGLRMDEDAEFEIRLLDVQSGIWHTLVQVSRPGDDADVYILTTNRLMSWTR